MLVAERWPGVVVEGPAMPRVGEASAAARNRLESRVAGADGTLASLTSQVKRSLSMGVVRGVS